MSDLIQLELNRAFAMAAAWDEAAEALRNLDLEGCDRALSKFNQIHREPREALAERAQQAAGHK